MITFPIVTSKQRTVLAVAIFNIVCPFVAISLRILSQRIAHRNFTTSDYCAIIATLFAIALQVLIITSVTKGGVGFDHVPVINTEYGIEPVQTIFKLLVGSDVVWTFSLLLSRASMLLLYSKLFNDTYMALASRITMAFTITWALPTILINFLICQPFSATWTPGGDDRCGDRIALFTSTAVLNLISDLAVVVLPLPHLYRLRLPKLTKLGLAIVMSLGIL